ncbi:class I adenylate-forming enzyme family protein [Parahaliea mediterranea]|uniref:AMP-binding protein n=1 Tax=Parahaliea mediterranea TaxID=651086 RepID=A0A939IMC5_9GAMM|nr:AMP-binding protein [Parahaliea mediterranea]MBN7796893.1 AMP-binding protein [Parahaliea mediterranea]
MSATCLDLINRGGRAMPDATAITFGEQSLSFAAVTALSNQLARVMIAEGLGRGDRVALLVNNGLYSVPLDFACVKAGLNRVPLNPRLSVTEHGRMLAETDCSQLIYSDELAGHASALAAAHPGLAISPLGNNGDTAGLLRQARAASTDDPDLAVEPDDVVLTLFTSGTTGTLKAAQHTQASYAAICRNVMLNVIDVRPGDAMLHAASLIHASGVFVLPYWLRGARTVIMSGFDPDAYLRLLAAERITAINLVPTMLQMLLDHPAFENTDVDHLRQVIYGASPMPRPVIERAMAAWGRERFWQYYGQTECPLAICVLRPEEHAGDALGSCGRPALDVELRLVDGDGNDVPPGEPGEIAVRADQRMLGYYNAPALNAAMFLDDGWLRTRDVAVFDEQGLLHIRDRTSDMIITGGYNVYPREVEDVLMSHPAVAECAVVGVEDARWVEAVTAAVTLRPGQTASPGDLIAHVAARVASYKKPRQVVFVDAVPKTTVGKINRKALRDALNGGRDS